jgi:TatD DNase family protein
MFINAHSHKKAQNPDEWVCRNAFHFLGVERLNKLGYPVSVGWHPWYADRFTSESQEALASFLKAGNVVAIGETGLDRSVDVPFSVQMNTWISNYNLAQKQFLPMIIHCVKAYYDLVPFCKQSSVPMLFHGYRGNQEITQTLLECEPVWFSFGKDLLSRPQSRSLFTEIPLSRILLETDNSGLPIARIYEEAAALLHLTPDNVKVEMKKNALRFFGEKALVLI